MFMVRMTMKVRVRVHDAAVRMAMGVNKICSEKQIGVGEDLRRCPFGNHAARLKHQHPISNVLNNFQLMSRCEHSLRRAFPLLNEVHNLALTLRIERRGWFVEQQYLRVEDQHRGQGNPLFLTSREPVRRTVSQV